MMVAEERDVTVFCDDLVAIILCEWKCPHCGEENVFNDYTRNVDATAYDFSVVGVPCKNCKEQSMILCRNATRNYKVML